MRLIKIKRQFLKFALFLFDIIRYHRDFQEIKNVQNRPACFGLHDYSRSTPSRELVNKLGWVSLEVQKLLAQAVLFSKIKSTLINITFPFPSHAFLQPHANIFSCSYSQFVRSVRIWNNLFEQTRLWRFVPSPSPLTI